MHWAPIVSWMLSILAALVVIIVTTWAADRMRSLASFQRRVGWVFVVLMWWAYGFMTVVLLVKV